MSLRNAFEEAENVTVSDGFDFKKNTYFILKLLDTDSELYIKVASDQIFFVDCKFKASKFNTGLHSTMRYSDSITGSEISLLKLSMCEPPGKPIFEIFVDYVDVNDGFVEVSKKVFNEIKKSSHSISSPLIFSEFKDYARNCLVSRLKPS